MTDPKHYTTDSADNVAVPTDRWPSYATALPKIMGEGTVRRYAREIADRLIADAQTMHGPVVWVTGNSMVPPLREISQAEEVWQAENNDDGELFAFLVSLLEDHLSAASVYMASPDYDNALYVVDLARWQYRDPEFSDPNFPTVPDDYSDDINDEWEPVDPNAVDDNAENPRE